MLPGLVLQCNPESMEATHDFLNLYFICTDSTLKRQLCCERGTLHYQSLFGVGPFHVTTNAAYRYRADFLARVVGARPLEKCCMAKFLAVTSQANTRHFFSPTRRLLSGVFRI